jgi:hypothetical protein
VILNCVRYDATETRTISKLSVNGIFFGYVLEDAMRPIKIPKLTAIPYGRYRVSLNPSKRFGRRMPLLLQVPNFDGVRIHAGNTDADTEGCLLVGMNRQGPDAIGDSRRAFDSLFARMLDADSHGEEIWISIEKGQLQADPERPVSAVKNRLIKETP